MKRRIPFFFFLFAFSLAAQIIYIQVQSTTANPSGACNPRSYLVFNRTTNQLSGCNGTWSVLATAGGGGGTVTSVGLSRTNDTNVTATITGSPITTSGTINVALGWTGNLSVARGGSGAGTLTGVLFGNGTSPFTATTLPSDATKFLNGTGAFTVPVGTGGTINSGTAGQGAVYTAATTIGGSGDGATWTACPTLQASWTNFGGGYQVCQYQKDSTERVWIRATLTAGTRTAGTTIFTMPIGYRPAATQALVAAGQATATYDYLPVQIDVQTGGAVITQGTAANYLNAGAWLFNLSYSIN